MNSKIKKLELPLSLELGGFDWYQVLADRNVLYRCKDCDEKWGPVEDEYWPFLDPEPRCKVCESNKVDTIRLMGLADILSASSFQDILNYYGFDDDVFNVMMGM